MCESLLDQRKEKLTARIIFASLRLSKSEPTSTSLYRVFRRILLLLNLFPSMFPSSKAWWSSVQAAQTVSMFSSVRAKRVKQHLLIKVKFPSVSNTDSVSKTPQLFPQTSSNSWAGFFPFSYCFHLLDFFFHFVDPSPTRLTYLLISPLAYLEHRVFQRLYERTELHLFQLVSFIPNALRLHQCSVQSHGCISLTSPPLTLCSIVPLA